MEAVRDVPPALATAVANMVGCPLVSCVAGAIARETTGHGEDKSMEEVAMEIMGKPEKLQRFQLKMGEAELTELKIRRPLGRSRDRSMNLTNPLPLKWFCA